MVLVFPLLAACAYGLDDFVVSDDILPVEPPVEGLLEGTTYSVPLGQVTVLEPVGLATVFEELTSGPLLFHVVQDRGQSLEVAIALGDLEGRQSECEPVHWLPLADFSHDPWLEIQGAWLSLTLGGEPVILDYLDMTILFAGDGERWEAGSLSAVLDTRQLSSLFKEGTDVCALVEGMDGSCVPCSDGEETCAVVELEGLTARKVPISFDPTLDTTGC